MIRFFPYLREQIDSGKTREEIYRILDSVTDSRKFILFPNAEFVGKVFPFQFTIYHRCSNFSKNSFFPVLAGTIIERKERTVIDIVLQVNMAGRIFIALWSGGLFCFFLAGLLAVFTDGTKGMLLVLAPIGMIAFGQMLMRFGFYGPARKALKRLRDLIC